MPSDIPFDMPATKRVTDGLVGFWTFDEASGAMNVADTSHTAAPVSLKVETAAMIFEPTFGSGVVTASMTARMISEFNTHLAADCATAGAVTLEAWVKPQTAVEGDAATPRFIAGLATNVLERDVVLLQIADKWVARVRTTANADGTPSLVSQSTADPSKFTHLVVVADLNQRTLYVDDVAEATDPILGGPSGWDVTNRMALFQEPTGGRPWLGSLHIVALYKRGLLPAEVDQNFQQHADAP